MLNQLHSFTHVVLVDREKLVVLDLSWVDFE